MNNHTVKTRPLPKGWERFASVPKGHPGDGWMSASEAGKALGFSLRHVRDLLKAAPDVDQCRRKIGNQVTVFYRPKSAKASR